MSEKSEAKDSVAQADEDADVDRVEVSSLFERICFAHSLRSVAFYSVMTLTISMGY